MVALTVWGLAPDHADTPVNEAGSSQLVNTQKRLSLPSLNMPLGRQTYDATVSRQLGDKPDSGASVTTLRDIQSQGILGQSPKWLSSLFESTFWTEDPDGAGKAFVNGNGLRIEFDIVGDQVFGAELVFPPKAVSADLTSASGFFVGHNSELPLHWEQFEKPEKPQREGRFQTTAGRTVYYRGRLRTSGEPPYGPSVLNVSLAPFEGQTFNPISDLDEQDQTKP